MQILGDKEKSQIDLYDTFGYLVPGAILVFFLLVSTAGWHSVSLKESYTFVSSLNVSLYLTAIIFLLVSSYVAGHVIASVAEIIFDRIFVGKIFQYPYVNLFFDKKNLKDNRANFYRSFITLVYLECIAISTIPHTDSELIRYIAALIPTFATIFLVLRWIQKTGIKHKNIIKPGWVRFILKTASHVLNIFAFMISRPFALLENFLDKLLGFDRSFPKKYKNSSKISLPGISEASLRKK